jgi:hypothetical protein
LTLSSARRESRIEARRAHGADSNRYCFVTFTGVSLHHEVRQRIATSLTPPNRSDTIGGDALVFHALEQEYYHG